MTTASETWSFVAQDIAAKPGIARTMAGSPPLVPIGSSAGPRDRCVRGIDTYSIAITDSKGADKPPYEASNRPWLNGQTGAGRCRHSRRPASSGYPGGKIRSGVRHLPKGPSCRSRQQQLRLDGTRLTGYAAFVSGGDFLSSQGLAITLSTEISATLACQNQTAHTPYPTTGLGNRE